MLGPLLPWRLSLLLLLLWGGVPVTTLPGLMASLIKRSVPGAGFVAPPALLLLLPLLLSAGFGVPALWV
jgi:hypothetical protein